MAMSALRRSKCGQVVRGVDAGRDKDGPLRRRHAGGE